MYTQHGFAVLQYHYTVRGEDARSATGTGSGRLLRCTTGGTALAPLPLVVSLASLRRYVEWNSKNAKLPALLQLRQARRTPSNTNSRSNGQSSNITHNNSVEDGAWMAAPHCAALQGCAGKRAKAAAAAVFGVAWFGGCCACFPSFCQLKKN